VLVTARTIELVRVEEDCVTIRLECSAGFYVRALAHALGEQLGVGAHLAALRRTRSGHLTLDEAVRLDDIDRDPDLARQALVPLSGMLLHLPAVTLTLEGVRRAAHGQDARPEDMVRGVPGVPEVPGALQVLKVLEVLEVLEGRRTIRLLDEGGRLVGVAEPSETLGFLHPAVVLV
jgi:tRNA U55 pseudouridine synthase TruB